MHLEWWQDLFDAWTRRLEPRRQHERFAEMRGIFVDRETRPIGRELEQHAARLLEVDRLEPEAIDHRRRMMPGRLDARSHLVLMLLVVHAPCEMMNTAHAPRSASSFGRFAHVEHAGRSGEAVPDQTVLLGKTLEAEHRREKVLGHLRF